MIFKVPFYPNHSIILGIRPYFIDARGSSHFCVLVLNLLFCHLLAVINVKRSHWPHGTILCVWDSLQMEALPSLLMKVLAQITYLFYKGMKYKYCMKAGVQP